MVVTSDVVRRSDLLDAISRGLVECIDAEDLELTFDEFSEIAASSDAPEATLRFAWETLGGWPQGLALLAVSGDLTSRRLFTARGIESFPAWVFQMRRYLVQKMQGAFTEEQIRFLLSTSLLPELDVRACAALMEMRVGQAQRVLDDLIEAGVALYAEDADGAVRLRYRKPFAAVFPVVFEASFPQEAPLFCERAVAWYEGAGDICSAAGIASRNHMDERLAEIVEAHYDEVVTSGKVHEFAGFVDAIASPAVRHMPRMRLVKAWSSVAYGDYDAASHLIGIARTSVLGENAEADALLSEDLLSIELVLRTVNYDAEGIVELAQGYDGSTAVRPLLAALYDLGLGLSSALTGELSEAEAHLVRALGKTGNVFVRYFSMFFMAETAFRRGSLDEASRRFGSAIDLAQEFDGAEAPFASSAYMRLASIMYERNEIDECRLCLSRGIDMCRTWMIPDAAITGHAVASHLGQLEGVRADNAAEVNLVESRRRSGATAFYQHFATHYSTKIMRSIAGSDSRSLAFKWSDAVYQAYLQGEREVDAVSLHEFLAVSYNLHSVGRIDSALSLLDLLVPIARDNGYVTELLDALILRALIRQHLRRYDEANDDVSEALALAEPRGFFRAFVDEGSEMASLLKRAQLSGVSGDYCARLLEAIGEFEQASAGAEAQDVVLSQREIQVLAFADKGLTNKEIARLLGLSRETIKSHLKNVSAKLGVSGRIEAVRKAAELGLLETE